MRRLALPLALVGLAATSARAGDEPKGPWDGFGVGSHVHQRTTQTSSMPGASASTSETKQTLVAVTDEAWTVRHETKYGDRWTAQEFTIYRNLSSPPPHAALAKPVDLGVETLTIDGREIACKKQRVEASGTTTTTWTNDELGLLKSETTGGATTSVTVTRLAAKTRIGDREVEFRETVTLVRTKSAAGENESKVTAWTSRAVPGGLVRSESVVGRERFRATTVTETIAFESKSEK